MKKQLLQTAVITAILSGVNGIVSAGGGQDADVMPVYTLDDVIVTAQRENNIFAFHRLQHYCEHQIFCFHLCGTAMCVGEW